MERRLAAILAADIVNFSRLVAFDEERTLAEQNAVHLAIIDPIIGEYGGRIFKTTGDGYLAEFSSVVDALRSAVNIQLAIAKHNREKDQSDVNLVYRMGVNLGDIVVENDDIYGNGVNVAARLESIAEPGGIFVSGTVFNLVGGRILSSFDDLGERQLKNIPQPVQV
jgi:adenylate cyclase